mgnify:CR=1 FL=1
MQGYLVTLGCGITAEVMVKTDLLTILLTGEAVLTAAAAAAVTCSTLGQAGQAGPIVILLTFRTGIGNH